MEEKYLGFNYAFEQIRIKSSWFDDEDRGKKNIYQKITYKGLYLYFTLYRFRVHKQENEHTFITSISLLRQETGYSTEEIFELLKKMKSTKIIDIKNISRWDYLYTTDSNGGKLILDKNILVIEAIDTFSILNYKEEVKDYYIYVDLKLMEYYKGKGLNEKHMTLYCFINKWNNNLEHKMYMSLEKMAEKLDFDKDHVHKMIYEMNRAYVLSSTKQRRQSKHGFYFEHYILDELKKKDDFIKNYAKNIDLLISKAEKRKQQKKQKNVESNVFCDTKKEVKWEFGERPNSLEKSS